MNSTSNKITRWLSVLVFALIGVSCLLVFLSSAVDIAENLQAQPEIFFVSYGLMRLLGVAIICLALAFYMVMEIKMSKPPGVLVTRITTWASMVGLVLLFLLPAIVHNPLQNLLFDQGYKYCEPKSHQWLMNSRTAYVLSVEACITPD